MVQDTTDKQLWRVIVSSLYPNDHKVQGTFEGYYANEDAARGAALHQEAINHGGSTIPTIVKAERVI